MEFIAHRINTISELKNLPKGYGVELDLRDSLDGSIYIQHNPFEDGENFEEYLKYYHHGTMILNIKSERIELKISELLKKYNIKKYFFLDSSFPMIYLLSNQGEKNIALRVSEFEGLDTAKNMAGKVNWIWVDCFTKIPIEKKEFEDLKAMGYKLCFVSPELQGRQHDIENYKQYLEQNNITMDAVCTKVYNIEKWGNKREPNMIQYGHQYIDDDDIRAVTAVLKSDFLTQGPAVSRFENKICEITGAGYCVAVSNATAGLHIAVQALNLPEASEGITTPNTFLASANCLLYNKLKPVFADINPDTYNIDPNQIEQKVTVDTKVLIPVHFAGLACDMERIKNIADAHNIKVIEDAAHAIGSRYVDGIPVGSCKYSDMTVFSFHPVKTITTGEGGAITINDESLYKRLLQLRSHGMTKDTELLTQNPGQWYYEMHSLGFNYRMTDIQAALGYSQLLKLERFRERRQHIVDQYNAAFDGIPYVKLPYRSPDQDSCFHLYVLQIDFGAIGTTRKDFMKKLADKGIGTQVHYIPVHTQPYYKTHYNYKIGDYPIAEHYYERALSLPLYPAMSDDDVQKVIDAVKELVQR